MMDREIQFYYREGCHLCEEMAAVLHRGWPEIFAVMHWIPVDSTPDLEEAFGTLIPVLEVDGQVVCKYFADVEEITSYFGPPMNPV